MKFGSNVQKTLSYQHELGVPFFGTQCIYILVQFNVRVIPFANENSCCSSSLIKQRSSNQNVCLWRTSWFYGMRLPIQENREVGE